MKKSLILASTSPFRKALLEKLSLEFECHKPHVDETPQPNESAEQLVLRLAEQKAHAVAKDASNSLVIGSDQVALFEGEILGKPHTRENAIAQLMRFSGKRVTFLTGLCLTDADSMQTHSLVEPFYVEFRPLTRAQVERYVDKEQPLNCAGSFKSEGLGICLFNKLEGDDPNALVGLPLIKLVGLLADQGVVLPQ